MTGRNANDVINGLRLDLARWKAELEDLRESGQADLADKVSGWIAEAEKVIAKWDAPRTP